MTEKLQIGSISILLLIGAVVGILALQPPKDFPVGEPFSIEEGETLVSISTRLEERRIVSSALFFRAWISTMGRDKDIDLGVYEFDTPMSLGRVVAKIVKGPDAPLISVTIPEGFATEEIASAYAKMLPMLSSATFIAKVKEYGAQGYLFPSTYYPLPSYTEEEIIKHMKATFEREYAKHFKDETFPPRLPTRADVVNLAAILEGEAKTKEDMKIVSGILQKRMEKGMRLQVDVAMETYKTEGLPKEPINNPGLVALDAVFHPTPSEYLYYITGKDGTMHYAKTFDEHKRNIKKYL